MRFVDVFSKDSFSSDDFFSDEESLANNASITEQNFPQTMKQKILKKPSH